MVSIKPKLCVAIASSSAITECYVVNKLKPRQEECLVGTEILLCPRQWAFLGPDCLSPNGPLVTKELPWGDQGGFQWLGEDISEEGLQFWCPSKEAVPEAGSLPDSQTVSPRVALRWTAAKLLVSPGHQGSSRVFLSQGLRGVKAKDRSLCVRQRWQDKAARCTEAVSQDRGPWAWSLTLGFQPCCGPSLTFSVAISLCKMD